ncbi:flagellar hook-basal body complex protein [Pseudoroseicyclus tamaricis]|uniref:Flagellar basal-body rod protein FlgF n=1 Tax=Pseudoroseicyclus tamaricis TaxID=2705421 RepID=A0A6B2JTJ8_9RHOB|nr:flagellar hook-basal body complex protein [Pseudoroseicyclus tamaricis]NDU99503.1 flagellar hook-basal body complex protein [Pseudoroseicyclus tamaricis]
MDNAIYAGLTRQTSLMQEMQSIANNIANAATTGFRAEGMMFSEYVALTGPGEPSLSMGFGNVGLTSAAQGALTQTGGPFDLAVEGPGYFLVATPEGERLTRAGAFTPSANGDLVTAEGYNVLDAGGAPVFIPQGAGPVSIAPDGTISAGGQPVGQIGLVRPLDAEGMRRADGVRFEAPAGWEPELEGRMVQGFLEGSNVDPLIEVARMIEVSRAYELGQSLADREDERIRATIESVTR